MNSNTRELMQKHNLNFKEFNFGYYTGQAEYLRKFLIEKIGIEKVAKMSDSRVCEKVVEMGYIPMQISFDNGCDGERIFLVPIHIIDKLETLER